MITKTTKSFGIKRNHKMRYDYLNSNQEGASMFSPQRAIELCLENNGFARMYLNALNGVEIKSFKTDEWEEYPIVILTKQGLYAFKTQSAVTKFFTSNPDEYVEEAVKLNLEDYISNWRHKE